MSNLAMTRAEAIKTCKAHLATIASSRYAPNSITAELVEALRVLIEAAQEQPVKVTNTDAVQMAVRLEKARRIEARATDIGCGREPCTRKDHYELEEALRFAVVLIDKHAALVSKASTLVEKLPLMLCHDDVQLLRPELDELKHQLAALSETAQTKET